MSKIDEIAEQAAAKRYPDTNGSTSVENFYPYKDSEIQAIKQNAFADGYCRALVDLYPVVKPEDLVEDKWYHLGDCGIDGSEWNIGQFFGVIDGNFRFFIEGLLFEFSDCPLIRGPILNPIEVGIVGGEG